jgi:phosphoribosylaminoimidazole (AIR) synthetase
MQRLGKVEPKEMDRVFNQGIGFVVIASPHFAESICRQFLGLGVPAWVIGGVVRGEAGVEVR